MATIIKRGDRWQAKVRRRGYPNQTKMFTTKRESQAWAAVIESEMARSVFIDRSKAEQTTFREVVEDYIKNVTPTHKGRDSESLRLKKFLRDQSKVADHSMAILKTHYFEEYRDRRLKEVSPGTVKRELNLLHGVIEVVRKNWE